MKKYLIISLLILVFSVVVVSAATTDFVANGDITISNVNNPDGPPTANLTIVSGSRAESWSYNGGNFSVTNPDATNLFTVSASGVSSVRVNNSASQEVACGSGSVQLPSTAGLYRVFASDSSCAGSSSSSSSSSSGGGGGYVPPPVTPPVVPATPAIPGISPAIPASPAFVHASPRAAFNRRLVVGSVGSDVKNLQQFLNANGFIVSVSGAGSPGRETATFGPATKRALIKYQIARGIIQKVADDGAGELGPKTRKVINDTNVATAPVLTSDRQVMLDSLRSQLNQLLEQLRQLQAQQAAGR